MNKTMRVGDRTEPCATPMLTVLGVEQSTSTTAEMDRSERRLEMRVERESYPREGTLESLHARK